MSLSVEMWSVENINNTIAKSRAYISKHLEDNEESERRIDWL